MHKKIYCKLLFLALLFAFYINTEAQTITFFRNYGGIGLDDGRCVQQTSDGGYIVVGESNSFGGDYDIYLIKTNQYGDTIWTKTFGGSSHDYGKSVTQTIDNGYIITGYSYSFGVGFADVYLIKTNADGDTLWSKTYGGNSNDFGYSVQQTSDSGYIVVGFTNSFGAGDKDVYLIKTNANGDTSWTKTFGGINFEAGYSVQQTIDGGYIIVGTTKSFANSFYDIYLIKTDANGDTFWTKSYENSEFGYSVQQTSDSGFIFVGGDESGDVLLIKTDINGDTLWTKSYGGNDFDEGYSVQQTTDNGYILVGRSGDIGFGDVFLIKTNVNGDTLWTKLYGGGGWEQGNSVQQTIDGGYIIVGRMDSGTVNSTDIYLIKTDSLGNIDTIPSGISIPTKKNKIHIYPNPSNESLFIDIKLQNPQKVKLKVFDIHGREIFFDTIEKFSNHYQLDISRYNKGIYTIHMKIGRENINEKIVIE